jgi:hypothetical protein
MAAVVKDAAKESLKHFVVAPPPIQHNLIVDLDELLPQPQPNTVRKLAAPYTVAVPMTAAVQLPNPFARPQNAGKMPPMQRTYLSQKQQQEFEIRKLNGSGSPSTESPPAKKMKTDESEQTFCRVDGKRQFSTNSKEVTIKRVFNSEATGSRSWMTPSDNSSPSNIIKKASIKQEVPSPRKHNKVATMTTPINYDVDEFVKEYSPDDGKVFGKVYEVKYGGVTKKYTVNDPKEKRINLKVVKDVAYSKVQRDRDTTFSE